MTELSSNTTRNNGIDSVTMIQPLFEPEKIKFSKKEGKSNTATFELGPFPPGLGTTVGNTLVPALYKFSRGYAVTAISITPSVSETKTSSKVEGLKEDIEEILQNVKGIRFKEKKRTTGQKEIVKVTFSDDRPFTAKAINLLLTNLEVVNPNHIIFHPLKKVKLDVELTIEEGQGYCTAEEVETNHSASNIHYPAAIFSPIVVIEDEVENTLVGKRTDYEKLYLTIQTDGTATPEAVVKQMGNQILQHLKGISASKYPVKAKAFPIGPYQEGIGIILCNALRRTLYRFTKRYAITSVKFIPQVAHEFSTIEGIIEDVPNIISAFRQVRIKRKKSGNEEKVRVSLANLDTFTAGDINRFTNVFEIVNPDYVVCHIGKNIDVEIELTIQEGRGYVASEEHKPDQQELGVFPMDVDFCPIKNIKIHQQKETKEGETFLLTIETDKSISPLNALQNSIDILSGVMQVVAGGAQVEQKERKREAGHWASQRHILLNKPIAEFEDIDEGSVMTLKSRGVNCLADVKSKLPEEIIELREELRYMDSYLRQRGTSLEALSGLGT